LIKLTRFNGKIFYLNPLHIETVEATPDTTITLLTGKSMVVKESVQEVISQIKAFFSEVGIRPPVLREFIHPEGTNPEDKEG